MKQYTLTPETSSNEISQLMSDLEKEIDIDRQALNIIEDKLAELAIQRTKLLLEQKEQEPNRIKAEHNLKRKQQEYDMLKRNYFLQGKRGL